jgi:hypothetical protein
MNKIQTYNSFLLEGDEFPEFKVGDYVKVYGLVNKILFNGQEGIINMTLDPRKKHLVTFPTRFNSNLHSALGIDSTQSSYYIDDFNMKISDGKEYKKIIDRKKTVSDDIDPFGEEIWDNDVYS